MFYIRSKINFVCYISSRDNIMALKCRYVIIDTSIHFQSKEYSVFFSYDSHIFRDIYISNRNFPSHCPFCRIQAKSVIKISKQLF